MMPEARARLMQELMHDTWVMLRPSPVAGVGVFAIRDIPKGCRTMFGPPDSPDDWVVVSRAEVEALPEASRLVVENYCLYDAAQYYVPARGFKQVDLACFLNHADAPNVVSQGDGAYFEALRDISAGEELFVDYGEIVTDEA
jgi:SET domain-containing protein